MSRPQSISTDERTLNPTPSPPLSGITQAVSELQPAYFALTMATGIVSIAAELTGWYLISFALLLLNVAFYTALWALTGWRILRFPRNVLADFLHHGRCMGYFTAVAGTNVLGSQFVVVADVPAIAFALWGVGLFLWAALTYGVFATFTVKRIKPSLGVGINGGWLVAVVAAQSVTVLSMQLSDHFSETHEPFILFALGMWFGGAMLYVWIISLIFYRYMFFAMEPSDLAPPYWINMGAMAISTLAGTMLLQHTERSVLLGGILPFIKGLTLFFWSTATWWIPMLLALGFWRHILRRFPIRYDPLYWGAVFPLGMYTACTYRLANTADASFLINFAKVFFWIAAGAWSLTLFGLCRQVIRPLTSRMISRATIVS